MQGFKSRLNQVQTCASLQRPALQDTPPVDIELGLTTPTSDVSMPQVLRGFPSLAAFISSNCNSESFVYKRFDQLAARNLLYLPSELAHLHDRLEEFDRADCTGPCDLEARRCARSWEEFERVKDVSAKQRERWDLISQIRSTLREYRKPSYSRLLRFVTI